MLLVIFAFKRDICNNKIQIIEDQKKLLMMQLPSNMIKAAYKLFLSFLLVLPFPEY